MPRTSIILVTYRTGPTLLRAIDSALRQSAEIELIVVDNGNPDDIVVKLKSLRDQEPRMKLITGHGNIGFSRANNLGVQASKGEHILILNPDCILPPDTIEKFNQHAEHIASQSAGHAFLIGARIFNENGSDQRGCRRDLLTPATAFVEALHLGKLFPKYRLNRHEEALPEILSPIPAISGACMFTTRSAYDAIGGFDEGYFLHVEDLDFCLRFRRAKGDIYFAPDVKVLHIGGTSDTTSDFIERHKMSGFIRYFHKNFNGQYPLILLWGLDIAIMLRYLLRRAMMRSDSSPASH